MHRDSRFRLGVLLVIFAAGCSQLRVADPTSPYFLPPPGSQVVVKQRLEVPPGMTRVYLQHGKVIPKSERNDYAVNCNFEINTLSDLPRHIDAGIYTVTKTRRRTDSIVSREPVHVASLAMSMDDRGGGSALVFEQVRMSLTSTPPSDIRELACRGVMTEPDAVELPTLAEMRQALGDYAEIRVPEEGGLLH